MAKNSIYDYDKTASNNTDIAGIGILGTNAVSNFDDAFRTIMAQIATDVSPRRFAIQGALYGLTLANNASDATNDIDVAVGMATSDSTTDPRTIVLASALTKRLDAAWAVGSGNGGLDTGSIANTTYHVWLIQRSDTGVVDVLFSTSATSPTMPANYDRKRRIGSILRESAAIVAFTQNGDVFKRQQSVDRNSTATTAAVALALSVPVGINVQPILNLSAQANQNTDGTISIGNGFDGGNSMNQICRLVSPTGAVPRDIVTIPGGFFTNTLSQIYFAQSVTTGTFAASTLNTVGWIDTRGRI